MNVSGPFAFAAILLGSVAHAQTPPAMAPAAMAPAAIPMAPPAMAMTDKSDQAVNPDALAVFFDLGSATIRPQDVAVLDKASRMYTDGKPSVMILTGSTDGLGHALPNMRLSQQRALAVLTQLVARGIPPECFQLLAKGVSEPAAPDASGLAEPRDRRVGIAWR